MAAWLVYSITSLNYFPRFFCELVKNGEISNSLGFEMENASKYYFDKANQILSKLALLVEPIMIVTISLFIGIIMASVFIPMFSLMNSLM